MINTRKFLFKSLLAASITSSSLIACTKNDSNETEKKALESATSKQETMAKEAQSLQSQLNALITENNAVKAELLASREQLDKDIQEFSDRRDLRERQIYALTRIISDYEVKISELESRLAELEVAIQQEETRLIERTKIINSSINALTAEQQSLSEKISTDNTTLVDIRTRIATAERTLKQKIDSIIEEAEKEADAIVKKAQEKEKQAQARLDQAGQEATATMKKAHEDATIAVQEANKKAHQLLTEARSSAEDEKARADQAIQQDRATFDAEMEKREGQISSQEEEAIQRLAELNADREKLTEKQEKLAADLGHVMKQHKDLEQAAMEVEASRAELITDQEVFAKQVEATRAMFLNQGLEDTWADIERGTTYSFRVNLIGQGSVFRISEARQAIKQFNKDKGLEKDNSNQELFPVLIKTTNSTSKDRKLRQETKNASIYSKQSDQFIVQDSYIVTGTVEDVYKLVQENNIIFNRTAKTRTEGMANLILQAHPITKVKVVMTIDLYGSSSLEPNRRIQKFQSFDIDPLIKEHKSLSDIDLSKPSQYVLKNLPTPVTCETVDVDCLKSLKSSGLLDKEVSIGYVNSNGQRVRAQKISIATAIEELLKASSEKLYLHRRLRQRSEQGGPVTPTLWRKGLWYERIWPGDQTFVADSSSVDFSEIEEYFQKLQENEDMLAKFNSQPVVERIEISYAVQAIDEVENLEDNLSPRFMTPERTDDGVSLITEIRSPGEFEVDLPITTTDKTSSAFLDLSLADFDDGLQKPIRPVVKDFSSEKDYQKAVAEYETQLEAYNQLKEKERISEFENRSSRLSSHFDYIFSQMRDTDSKGDTE